MINYSRSREQQMTFMRRRIGVGLVALVLLAVIALVLTRSSGKKTVVGPKTTVTTGATVTTTPAHLVVATEPWQLPSAVSREVVLPLGGGLTLFGGLGTGNRTNPNIVALDPANGKNVTLAALPQPVHDAAGAVIGGTQFVFGGGAATESAAVQAFNYDPTTKAKPTVVASLPAKRADLSTAASADGKVYLAGGFDGKKWLPDVLETSDGKTFASIAQLSTPVRYPASAVLNGKLYVFGGEVSPNQADATVIQEVDLQTHAVNVVGQIAGGLSHAVAATLNNVVYVFGGRSGGHAVDTISAFDPASGQLQPVAHLGTPTSDIGLAVLNQAVYLVGGENDAKKEVATVFVARLGTGTGAA